MNIDWPAILLPQTPVLEIFARGTIVYLGIFILMRVVMKRETGQLGMADVLLVVLLADAAQNAMAGDYNTIADGMLLVATILFWSYALDWLGYHSKFLRKFIFPPPLLLIKDGRMLRQNMRKELITPDELTAALRERGVEDVSQVKKAYIESEGRISIIRKDRGEVEEPQERPGG